MKKIIRPLLFSLGLLSLLIGIAGIFIPLLPTTPFLLLTAFLWAKSSARFHAWLLAHHRFGPLIHNWQSSRSIPRRAKYIAVLMMTVSLGWLFIFHLQSSIARLALTLIFLPPLLWMLSRPDAPSPSADSERKRKY